MRIDSQSLAEVLAIRFRLALSDCVVQTPSGTRHGIRAMDIPEPNGFAVLISTGWRSLDADFSPDTYAGELVRAMGQNAPASSQIFVSLAQSFESIGNRIHVKVNGSVVSLENGLPPPPWSKFDLNVRKLTNVASDDAATLQTETEDIAAACLALILALLPLEEESASQPLFEAGLPEGACSSVMVNRYERNPLNRAACIAAHGSRCKICGFDFGAVYGPLANGYIEVHHRIPVSQMGASYRIDPVNDLIPLCSNCHAALHRVDPPMEPEALIAILTSAK